MLRADMLGHICVQILCLRTSNRLYMKHTMRLLHMDKYRPADNPDGHDEKPQTLDPTICCQCDTMILKVILCIVLNIL